MNSLNLLSARVIGQSPLASRPRSRSQGEVLRNKLNEELLRGRSYSEERVHRLRDNEHAATDGSDGQGAGGTQTPISEDEDEKQPLLNEHGIQGSGTSISGWRHIIKRIADAITAILSTIGVPMIYLVKCFQDDGGRYSPMAPFRSRPGKGIQQPLTGRPGQEISEKPLSKAIQDTKLRHSYSSDSLNSTTSESESERKKTNRAQRNAQDRGEEPKVRRQSARIKLLHNDEASQQRKKRNALSEKTPDAGPGPLTVDNLKSPTSAATSLRVTRYPHTPNAPRPLVPRRQPSYSNLIPHLPTRTLSVPQQKTLVLDLDETLIHSLAKGGRMSTGHMVEVKLNVPVAVPSSIPGQHQPAMLGPQHPILYYVHKRPHCDDFLRKVCKWYKLVIFTASVQEYADPVIDWLEQERKYFSARLYRQHCTFRNGSYIKDLSSIEPDLSKVIILDNSPVSYIFHEDNAIPIEGWINDPTDNDLLHLIPMLEALQYVTDVRALLALRRGEAEAA